jgi:glycosyltransferase involved in cell wall biosynthesis
MIHGKKVIVVMPAYNAAETLEKTYNEIPLEYIDEVVLVDDASRDDTVAVAKKLGISTVVHLTNKGYGGNQKTCYKQAIALGADIVVMLHPDYQYTPKLLVAMASLIGQGQYDVVLGSRILCGGAMKGGMPLYKYFANRLLTFTQNVLMSAKLSEYHTGYRAFSKEVLISLPLEENSDDFVFDNQMISQAIFFGYRVGEISCPALYFKEASSINFRRSVTYGLGVLATSFQFFFERAKVKKHKIFASDGRRLEPFTEPSATPVSAMTSNDADKLPAGLAK